MRAVGVATLATAEIRSRQMAEWVAQNRLAELRVMHLFLNEGTNEGDAVQGDQEFHCRFRRRFPVEENSILSRGSFA